MSLVTLEDYQEMVADRPEKFAPEEVDYDDSDGPERCARCIHFYRSEAAERTTCEVMRPEDDEDVNPAYRCQFFTVYGQKFPMLDAELEAQAEPEEEAKEEE